MNILFTCAGRRNYLLEYFKMLDKVKVFACDASINAPAIYIADEHFIVPEVYDLHYIDILLKESMQRDIHAIIPLNDIELPILAEHKHKFEAQGIKVIVSDPYVIDICFDKYKSFTFSENLSVTSIPTFLKPEDALKYLENNPDCRFVIKPRWGSASIGISYPQDEKEIHHYFNQTKSVLRNSFLSQISSTDFEHCVLIQRKISGQEYGMDVINNLKTEYEATLIRKKITMRSGETDKAETVLDAKMMRIGEEIGKKLKHAGNLDCDLFIEDDRIYLLEMNPRFGGGYPFMHYAGANLPMALVEWLKGNNAPDNCFKYKVGSRSAKVDKIVTLNGKRNEI